MKTVLSSVCSQFNALETPNLRSKSKPTQDAVPATQVLDACVWERGRDGEREIP